MPKLLNYTTDQMCSSSCSNQLTPILKLNLTLRSASSSAHFSSLTGQPRGTFTKPLPLKLRISNCCRGAKVSPRLRNMFPMPRRKFPKPSALLLPPPPPWTWEAWRERGRHEWPRTWSSRWLWGDDLSRLGKFHDAGER